MGKKQKKRSETEIILQRHSVVLGGESRSFTVKPIGETHEFRRELGKLVASVMAPLLEDYESAKGEMDIAAAIRSALPLLLSDGVDSMIEMLWLYAPELKKFEEGATGEEIFEAALEVFELEFPLVQKIVERSMRLAKRLGITLRR